MFFKNYLNIDRNKNNLVITTYFTTRWTYIMKYNRIKIILQVNLKKDFRFICGVIKLK